MADRTEALVRDLADSDPWGPCPYTTVDWDCGRQHCVHCGRIRTTAPPAEVHDETCLHLRATALAAELES